MKNCFRFLLCFFKKKTQITPNIINRETKEDILRKELNAFIELEIYNISDKFINRHGLSNVKSKLIQQYYWIKNNNISDKDRYITLNDWHNRFN